MNTWIIPKHQLQLYNILFELTLVTMEMEKKKKQTSSCVGALLNWIR